MGVGFSVYDDMGARRRRGWNPRLQKADVLPVLHLSKRNAAGMLRCVTKKPVLFPLWRVGKGNAAGILRCAQDDKWGWVSFLIERCLQRGFLSL